MKLLTKRLRTLEEQQARRDFEELEALIARINNRHYLTIFETIQQQGLSLAKFPRLYQEVQQLASLDTPEQYQRDMLQIKNQAPELFKQNEIPAYATAAAQLVDTLLPTIMTGPYQQTGTKQLQELYAVALMLRLQHEGMDPRIAAQDNLLCYCCGAIIYQAAHKK